jgi:hypothetical protein
MDRRSFIAVASSAIASASIAGNPFVANDPAENPFVAKHDPPRVESVTFAIPSVRHGVIEFYTGNNCVWCEKWKRDVLPACVKAGWRIDTRIGAGAVPYFTVWQNGKAYKHQGYMSLAAMKKLLGRHQTAALQPPNIHGYRARWTHPSDLRRHLAASPHNIDATGWTWDQMEFAHDQHHQKMKQYGRSVMSDYSNA